MFSKYWSKFMFLQWPRSKHSFQFQIDLFLLWAKSKHYFLNTYVLIQIDLFLQGHKSKHHFQYIDWNWFILQWSLSKKSFQNIDPLKKIFLIDASYFLDQLWSAGKKVLYKNNSSILILLVQLYSNARASNDWKLFSVLLKYVLTN